jgi:hypothetical protein
MGVRATIEAWDAIATRKHPHEGQSIRLVSWMSLVAVFGAKATEVTKP